MKLTFFFQHSVILLILKSICSSENENTSLYFAFIVGAGRHKHYNENHFTEVMQPFRYQHNFLHVRVSEMKNKIRGKIKINKRTNTDVRIEVQLKHFANLDFVPSMVLRKTSKKHCSQEGVR